MVYKWNRACDTGKERQKEAFLANFQEITLRPKFTVRYGTAQMWRKPGGQTVYFESLFVPWCVLRKKMTKTILEIPSAGGTQKSATISELPSAVTPQVRFISQEGQEAEDNREGTGLARGQPQFDPQHPIGSPEHRQE